MNFKKYHVSRNLINSDKLERGYLNTLGDVSAQDSTYLELKIDFIPVTETNYSWSLSEGWGNISGWVARCFYNESKGMIGTRLGGRTSETSGSFQIPSGTAYIRISWRSYGTISLMLNTGSSPLPYEPYSSEVWHDTPHYIHKADTDILTTLPDVVYVNDTTATVGLKGQATQSGTPSPDSPVMPQGTGNKTANLLDVTLFHNGYHINSQGNIETFTGRIATTTPIDVSNYTSITFSYTTTIGNDNFIYATFSGNTLVERVAGKTSGFTIDTTNCDKLYLCLYNLSSQVLTADIITAMLNKGSIPLPYEPYGYKIPISSANTTTPVYLREVQTTRKIKKYVFNGTEPWVLSSTIIYINNTDTEKLSPLICTHFPNVMNTGMWNGNNWVFQVDISRLGMSGRDAWITWLAAQYAAGTPVTVWYVLAEPTTGIVNEPLMKIGDYADSLTTSIPVTAGENTLDVQTTVQPSEVTAEFSGWHPVQSVHERENGQWD